MRESLSLHAVQDSKEMSRYFKLLIAYGLAKWDLLWWYFLPFFHFFMVIYVMNNFCIKQTLYQVYSHMKGQCLTILDMFFISYYHHINFFKLNKRQNSSSNDSKGYSSGHSALPQILTFMFTKTMLLFSSLDSQVNKTFHFIFPP